MLPQHLSIVLCRRGGMFRNSSALAALCVVSRPVPGKHCSALGRHWAGCLQAGNSGQHKQVEL